MIRHEQGYKLTRPSPNFPLKAELELEEGHLNSIYK